MVSEYGCDRKDIICAIGPSICRKCYEVSEDVAIEFKKNFSEKMWNNFWMINITVNISWICGKSMN